MPLFAEVPDWAIWIVAMVSGGAVWLINQVRLWNKEKRDIKKDDEKGIVEHQGKTIERLSRELEEARKQLNRQGSLLGRLLAHVGYIEGLLTAKGEKDFARFDLDGTAEHQSLAAGE